MAIKIPSKHIYSINYDPVVDNNIDNVEFEQAVLTTEDKINETVFLQSIEPATSLNRNTIAQTLIHYLTSGGTVTGDVYVGVDFRVYYAYQDITITIPRKQFNETVYRVYDGVYTDDYGKEKTYIQLSINKYKYIQGQPQGRAEADINYSNGAIIGLPRFLSGLGNSNWEFVETVEETPKNIVFKQDRIYQDGNEKSGKYITYNIDYSFNIPNQENVKTQKFVYNSTTDTYDITLRLLTNLEVYNLCGYNPEFEMAKVQEYVLIFLFGGEKYELDSITVMGNRYTLKQERESKTIGNGDSPFSFDGNELIQTTNTPTPETKYQGVIDEWKNGKQTAVITCPIVDYYDENAKTEEITETEYVGNSIDVQAYHAEAEKYVDLGYDIKSVKFVSSSYRNPLTVTILSTTARGFTYRVELETWVSALTNIACVFEVEKYIQKPDAPIIDTSGLENRMVFDIGDIVVPYVFTNKGDKPMAYNRDLTPKKFKVVGTKISKRQGGSQELTLLEE